MNTTQRELHDALVKQLAAEGKLLEIGFVAMRFAIIPPTASEEQIEDMRIAYMAGAQHLFASMMSFMDPGEEPTASDMNRMMLINREIEEFGKQLQLRKSRAEGTS